MKFNSEKKTVQKHHEVSKNSVYMPEELAEIFSAVP